MKTKETKRNKDRRERGKKKENMNKQREGVKKQNVMKKNNRRRLSPRTDKK